MNFRLATAQDIESIALLHAQSWQKHYRGIFLDNFLASEVISNRLAVWQARLSQSIDNQLVIIAEQNQQIQGFVCVLVDEEDEWGALVDNLHTREQGKGLGKILLSLAAKWVQENYPNSQLYLWVLEENHAARGFYDKLGGENIERVWEENPGGGYAYILRYSWDNLDDLSSFVREKGINLII
jgi:ribosomal protein S18 acetylase RimI-like enzyme